MVESVNAVKILPVYWSGVESAWRVLLGVSRKSGRIKPIGGNLNLFEGHIIGATREFGEETDTSLIFPLEFLGSFREVTREKSDLKVGTVMLVSWYLLKTDEIAVGRMQPRDDICMFKPVGIDEVALTLSHASTREVYEHNLHPILRKWFVD